MMLFGKFPIADRVLDSGGVLSKAWRLWLQALVDAVSRALVLADIPDLSSLYVPVSGVASGTYTPTLTGVANVGASTAYACQYLRVGTTVTVSGRVDVDPTAAVVTKLGITLPVASNIGASKDLAGCAAAPGIAGQSAALLGDATNNRAQLEWIAVDITNQAMYFTFTYQVLA